MPTIPIDNPSYGPWLMESPKRAGCGPYNPCPYAQRLEAKGEEDRGRRDQQITKLEAENARLKRLEAILRNEADVEDVPDCGDEQRVRPNAAMRLLAEWEGKV
jgi:hypothetical protein